MSDFVRLEWAKRVVDLLRRCQIGRPVSHILLTVVNLVFLVHTAKNTQMPCVLLCVILLSINLATEQMIGRPRNAS